MRITRALMQIRAEMLRIKVAHAPLTVAHAVHGLEMLQT